MRNPTTRITLAALVLTTALVACADTVEDVPFDRCASGLRWIGDDSESDEMLPGSDCIGCHAEDDGPEFAIAGTVMPILDEPDDCFGVEGVTVEITDADGEVTEVTTNRAGNFYVEGAVARPYQVRLIQGDEVRVMQTPVEDGSCNSCHTAEGEAGATGRALAP